ncbi:hypothetical protein DFH28DRAFT_988356 [Melampsora americana]|nr:hypothetical protein DFH28DRAFT_988356 [Melampsora americana]
MCRRIQLMHIFTRSGLYLEPLRRSDINFFARILTVFTQIFSIYFCILINTSFVNYCRPDQGRLNLMFPRDIIASYILSSSIVLISILRIFFVVGVEHHHICLFALTKIDNQASSLTYQFLRPSLPFFSSFQNSFIIKILSP